MKPRCTKPLTHGLRALGLSALLAVLSTTGQAQTRVRPLKRIYKDVYWYKAYEAGHDTGGSASLVADGQIVVLDFTTPDDLIMVQADGSASGHIKVLGHRVEAARVEARARVQNHQFEARPVNIAYWEVKNFGLGPTHDLSALVRIAGRDIYTKSSSGPLLAPKSFGPSTPPWNLNILDFKFRFSIGPVPCSLRVTAGATASVNTPIVVDPARLSVSLAGQAAAAANASLSFGVDIGVAEAGIRVSGRFADTRGTLAVGASPSGIVGSLGLRIQAIQLLCKAFVKVGYGWLSKTFSKTLFSYDLGAITTTEPLL